MENPAPKLDISEAWASATRMVATNRDMLMAIAGVFFLLPGLILSIAIGKPEIANDIPPEKAMEIVLGAYMQAAPIVVLVLVLQMAGTLTVMTVMTDRARPTVAQAIRHGFGATPAYLGTWVLLYVLLPFSLLMVSGLVSLLGVPVLTAVIGILLFGAVIFALLRTSLIAPVLACERGRNPIEAIRRSWHLTRGNAMLIFVFFALAWLLFLVVYGLVMMFAGVVLILVTSGDVQNVLSAAIASALLSVWLVYFAAMTAAVHAQLAGPAPGETGAVFE